MKGIPRRYRRKRELPRPWSRLERMAHVQRNRRHGLRARRRWQRIMWGRLTDHAPLLFHFFLLPLLFLAQAVYGRAIGYTDKGTPIYPIAGGAEGEGFPHTGATGGGANAQPASAANAGKTGIRDWFDYVADFAGAADGTNQAAKINAAFVTMAAARGGVLFFPPGVFVTNATVTVPQGCTIMGTGWDEDVAVQPRSSIALGSAMAVGVNLSDNGAAIIDMVVEDPAPFVTTALVQCNGAAWRIDECLLSLNAGALICVDVQAPRGHALGGRWFSGGANSIGLRQTSSDNMYGGDLRIISARSIHHAGGLNVQYTHIHATGGVNTNENILIDAGEALMVGVQTDASNNGGASVRVIPTNGQIARALMTGCHFLCANVAASTPCVETDSSAGGGAVAIAQLDGCSSRGDSGTPANFAYIVRKKNANDIVIINGGMYVDCAAYYDTAFSQPDVLNGPELTSGATPVKLSQSIFRRTTTADFTTTVIVLTNVTGAGKDMSFKVGAGEVCHFRAVLWVDALAADDMQIGFTGPAAPTSVRYGIHGFDAALAFTPTAAAAAFATAIVFGGNGAGVVFMVIVEGHLINGANAGTVQLQFAKNLNAGGTVGAIRAGSYLEKVATA